MGSAANHINKPTLIQQCVLRHFPLEITYVSFGDLAIQWEYMWQDFGQSDRPVGEVIFWYASLKHMLSCILAYFPVSPS